MMELFLLALIGGSIALVWNFGIMGLIAAVLIWIFINSL